MSIEVYDDCDHSVGFSISPDMFFRPSTVTYRCNGCHRVWIIGPNGSFDEIGQIRLVHGYYGFVAHDPKSPYANVKLSG